MFFILGSFANASTCRLEVYKTSCRFLPRAGYGCMRSIFTGAEFKLEVENLSMSNCLKKGTELMEQFWSEEESSRYKDHQDTDLFDEVKLKYSGDEGTLSASLKH